MDATIITISSEKVKTYNNAGRVYIHYSVAKPLGIRSGSLIEVEPSRHPAPWNAEGLYRVGEYITAIPDGWGGKCKFAGFKCYRVYQQADGTITMFA